MRRVRSAMSLVLRNLLFTVVVPGSGGVLVPWLILRHGGASPTPATWPGAAVIAVGMLLYAAAAAIGFHLLVVAYEEPKLRATFGNHYQRYRRAVPRWVPRRPRPSS